MKGWFVLERNEDHFRISKGKFWSKFAKNHNAQRLISVIKKKSCKSYPLSQRTIETLFWFIYFCISSKQFQEHVGTLEEQLHALASQRDANTLELDKTRERLEHDSAAIYNLQNALEQLQRGNESLICYNHIIFEGWRENPFQNVYLIWTNSSKIEFLRLSVKQRDEDHADGIVSAI